MKLTRGRPSCLCAARTRATSPSLGRAGSMFTRIALGATPVEAQPHSVPRRNSLCPLLTSDSLVRPALSARPRSLMRLSRYMPELNVFPPRPPRHRRRRQFFKWIFSFVAGPQVFDSPLTEGSTSAPGGGGQGEGENAGPQTLTALRPFRQGQVGQPTTISQARS